MIRSWIRVIAPTSRRSLRCGAALFFVLAFMAGVCGASPAAAQTIEGFPNFLKFPEKPKPPRKPKAPPGAQKQMLVQADELRYDYTNDRVSAVGNVQIYYNDSTIEADRVIYDQKTKRLHAEGNVRLTEADGKVTHGEILDLNEDYRDGFVDSLKVESPDQTRFAAARADRKDGNVTVLQSGVYTACEPCKDDPKKPPLWQIKGARIIHDQNEKMIYFEDATIEFFGQPIAYFPYFSAPDPSVKRKTGFLMPIFSTSSTYGAAIEMPYYISLAPDYDATITPLITTKQGPLLQGEFRQRLVNGSYTIRAAGIFQLDKDYFINGANGAPAPGYRDFRGSVETSGQFALNNKWVWGWDGTLLTDKTFFQDYKLSSFHGTTDPFNTGITSGVSQLYLTGKGDRSFFDIRSIYYYGFSVFDSQTKIPIIHPVMDYSYVFANPVLGGELSVKANLTSLSRQTADYQAITPTEAAKGLAACAAGAVDTTRANCVMRGMPGTYTRFTAEVDWRRTITDSFGQVFTPFASLRADANQMSITNDGSVGNFINTNDSAVVRAMPTVGLEYRYPFINVQSWGTQTIEPRAQVILRPNEPNAGKLPNEDAQSLIFDDSNLFKVDKFAGYDRIEGGGRANVGVQYTAQFNQGGFFSALFGQSYQLFGTNSFAVADATNTGINSGLDTTRSDYVARVSYQPDRVYTFTTRFRFDERTFDIRRFEAEARANFDRWSVALLYGHYDAQPEIGYLTTRQGILGSTAIKLTPNWVLQTAARYDIDQAKFDQTRIGVGYIDDCFILALNYTTTYNYNGLPTTDHRVMMQINLRTLGGTSVSQGVGGLPGGL